jgi:hypothetical protein
MTRRKKPRSGGYAMTTVLRPDGDSTLFTVKCDGCNRSASSAPLNAEALRDLIGWEHADDGTDVCTVCMWERGLTPRVAVRVGHFLGDA